MELGPKTWNWGRHVGRQDAELQTIKNLRMEQSWIVTTGEVSKTAIKAHYR